jgi:glycosyltransferase involved in cell wall biosynthesis
MMLVSIIITNYNYGAYLDKCIDSALNQSWPDKKILVVDDGSTDQSRRIIKSYSESITAIFKENGGHCSAANTGFEASSGDIVIFLDSDDYLLDGAVDALAEPFTRDASISKCQGYLTVIDSAGTRTGRTIPRKLCPSGNYRDDILWQGPDAYSFTYTSGSAWSRRFLCQVMPLPIPEFKRMGVDGYLNTVSTLFGRTEAVNRNVAAYRIHGGNLGPVNTSFTAESLRQRIRLARITQEHLFSWAKRLEYPLPADVSKRWNRGWRYSLLSYSLNAMEESSQITTFAEFVLSPFRSCHTNRLRALLLSALLCVVWFLPRRAGLRLARRMLKLPRTAL